MVNLVALWAGKMLAKIESKETTTNQSTNPVAVTPNSEGDPNSARVTISDII